MSTLLEQTDYYLQRIEKEKQRLLFDYGYTVRQKERMDFPTYIAVSTGNRRLHALYDHADGLVARVLRQQGKTCL